MCVSGCGGVCVCVFFCFLFFFFFMFVCLVLNRVLILESLFFCLFVSFRLLVFVVFWLSWFFSWKDKQHISNHMCKEIFFISLLHLLEKSWPRMCIQVRDVKPSISKCARRAEVFSWIWLLHFTPLWYLFMRTTKYIKIFKELQISLSKVAFELKCTLPSVTSVTVDYAVEMSHQALFVHQGQVCIAGSRTFVQEDIYDDFVKKSVERAKKRTVGDPFEATNEGGPQVTFLYSNENTKAQEMFVRYQDRYT